MPSWQSRPAGEEETWVAAFDQRPSSSDPLLLSDVPVRNNVNSMFYLASPADAWPAAIRNWVMRFGGGGPFGPVTSPEWLARAGPAQDKEQLINRYNYHTRHCKSCSKLLQSLTAVQGTLRLLSPLLIVACALAAVKAVATGSATLLVRRQPSLRPLFSRV